MEEKLGFIAFILALAVSAGAVFWFGERWVKKNRKHDAAILSSKPTAGEAK